MLGVCKNCLLLIMASGCESEERAAQMAKHLKRFFDGDSFDMAYITVLNLLIDEPNQGKGKSHCSGDPESGLKRS
jgi:hypothetical protein